MGSCRTQTLSLPGPERVIASHNILFIFCLEVLTDVFFPPSSRRRPRKLLQTPAPSGSPCCSSPQPCHSHLCQSPSHPQALSTGHGVRAFHPMGPSPEWAPVHVESGAKTSWCPSAPEWLSGPSSAGSWHGDGGWGCLKCSPSSERRAKHWRKGVCRRGGTQSSRVGTSGCCRTA